MNIIWRWIRTYHVCNSGKYTDSENCSLSLQSFSKKCRTTFHSPAKDNSFPNFFWRSIFGFRSEDFSPKLAACEMSGCHTCTNCRSFRYFYLIFMLVHSNRKALGFKYGADLLNICMYLFLLFGKLKINAFMGMFQKSAAKG